MAESLRCRGTDQIAGRTRAPDEHATCFTNVEVMSGKVRRVVSELGACEEGEARSAPSRMFRLAMMTELRGQVHSTFGGLSRQGRF